MSGNKEQFAAIAQEFVFEINAAHGLYLDALAGFNAFINDIEEAQKKGTAKDEEAFYYAFGDPNSEVNVLLHQTTVGALKERNREGSRNHINMARFLLVILFELWETGFRTRLAEAAGIKRETLLCPIFGDLRLCRHAILHDKGRLEQKDLDRLEVLTFETPRVDLFQSDVELLIAEVRAGIDEMVKQHAGVDPNYRATVRIKGTSVTTTLAAPAAKGQRLSQRI